MVVGTLHCSILVGTLQPRQGVRQAVRQGVTQGVRQGARHWVRQGGKTGVKQGAKQGVNRAPCLVPSPHAPHGGGDLTLQHFGGDPKTQYNFTLCHFAPVSPLVLPHFAPCFGPCFAPVLPLVLLLFCPLFHPCFTPCFTPCLAPHGGGDVTLYHFGGDTTTQIGRQRGSKMGVRHGVRPDGVGDTKTYVCFGLEFIGGLLESPQWSIGCFCPNILGRWWGPTKAFCGSVNVHWVVVLFSGGGDTSPLYAPNKIFLAAGGGDPKTQYNFALCHFAPVSPCFAPVSPPCFTPCGVPSPHAPHGGGNLTLQPFGGDTTT